jgi:flagellar basal-body rod modification protein FlgD
MAFPIVPVLAAIPSAIGAVKNALAAPAPPAPTRLGKDDFLKLLVAQLKHQNPLNPTSNDQLLAQSASFSTVEELQNIRRTLESSAGSGPASSLASSSALVGRSVTATTASFLYAGATATLPFALAAPTANASLEVSDTGGTVVARVPLGARGAGAQTVDFHPDAIGRVLPAGEYRYRIVAPDASGRPAALSAISGTVTGVTLDGTTPVLTIGARKIALTDVVAIGASTSQ